MSKNILSAKAENLFRSESIGVMFKYSFPKNVAFYMGCFALLWAGHSYFGVVSLRCTHNCQLLMKKMYVHPSVGLL